MKAIKKVQCLQISSEALLPPELTKRSPLAASFSPKAPGPNSLQAAHTLEATFTRSPSPSCPRKSVRSKYVLRPKQKPCLYYSADNYWKNLPLNSSPLRRIQRLFLATPPNKVADAAESLSQKAKLYPLSGSKDCNKISPSFVTMCPVKVHEKVTLKLPPHNGSCQTEPKPRTNKAFILGGQHKNQVMQKIVPRICTPEPLCESPIPIEPVDVVEPLKVIKEGHRKRKSTPAESKIKWYDVRPRLMINKYYKNNFAETAKKTRESGKGKIPLTVAHLWRSVERNETEDCFFNSLRNQGYRSAAPGSPEAPGSTCDPLSFSGNFLPSRTLSRKKLNVRSQEGVRVVRCILDFY